MPSEVSQSRRTQSKLLVSKLLDSRDSASPFTLIIDSLEQSARPLWQEYIRRAKANKTKTIFLSFETLRPPRGIDHFILAHTLDASKLPHELQKITSTSTTTSHVIIIDTLYPLLSTPTTNISTLLPSLITPTTSLLSIYHSEQPLPHHPPYAPHPLTLLKFLATTIMTTHSLSHLLAQKAARDRSIAAPLFGLVEDEEGVVQGLGANDSRGTVVECETRRKSGRGVEVWFVLPPVARRGIDKAAQSQQQRRREDIVLLEDHPLYRTATEAPTDEDNEYGEVSFNLSLTSKQRQARENVELPYFDAQKEGGGGEGGRILYDMGVEDDFDEEEDEI